MKKNAPFLLVMGTFIAWIIAVAVVAMLFSSCSTTRRVNRVMTNHPKEAAEACGRMFPPVASTKTVVEYRPGRTVEVPGPTVYVDCDSAAAAQQHSGTPAAPVIVRVPCPPATHQTDTLLRHDTTVVENTAALYACRQQAADQEKKISRQGSTITWLWWLAGAGWALHIIRIIIKKLIP